MNRSAISASVAMGQLQQKLNTIASNLANVNTYGYKARETTFSDLLVQQMNNQPDLNREIGRLTPEGIRSGTGARIAATAMNTELGTITETGRMLDIALTDKNMFFQLDVEGETTYTRDGAFYLTPSDTAGFMTIVASDGALLLGENGRIDIPANVKDIRVSETGQLSVQHENDDIQIVDQIALVEVRRPQMLRSLGSNRFAAPEADTGIPVAEVVQPVFGQAVFKQNALEASNVDIAKEVTSLLEMQRHYQLNARALTTADDMMGLVNQLR